MGALKGQPQRAWRTTEIREICQAWEAGIPVEDLARRFGRTEVSIAQTATRNGARRPNGFNRVRVWDRVSEVLQQHGPMSVAELVVQTGMWKTCISRAMREHRSELHVVEWRKSDRHDRLGKFKAVWSIGYGIDARKPVVQAARKANPFAAAAGLVSAPKGKPGRVVIHLTDDETEAA